MRSEWLVDGHFGKIVNIYNEAKHSPIKRFAMKPLRPTMTVLFSITIFSAFYVAGFGLLGYGLWNARRSMQAAAWPTAPATITSLAVAENSDGDGGTTYEVKVQYTYTVDGVQYEGSRLAFGYGGSSRRTEHDEIHRKLREAKAVAVRYDPSDPSVSCLSFGLHRSIQITLASAVVFLFGTTLPLMSKLKGRPLPLMILYLYMICVALVFWLFFSRDSVLLNNLSAQ